MNAASLLILTLISIAAVCAIRFCLRNRKFCGGCCAGCHNACKHMPQSEKN